MADPTRIFVSHSHHDNAWCHEFVGALQAAGLDVWYDEKGLSGGAAWVATIQREVQAREIFLLVLTPNAWDSRWVHEELNLALATNHRIVPIMHQTTQVEGFLLTRQWVNVVGMPGAEAAGKVMDEVVGRLPAPSIPPQVEPASPPLSAPAASAPVSASPSRQKMAKPKVARPHTRAITDLYDEERHISLIWYPMSLLLGLTFCGLLIFATTGFLGFRASSPTAGASFQPISADAVFREPWLLYIWLITLLVVLEVSILRSRALRSRLISTVLLTGASASTIGAVYFFGAQRMLVWIPQPVEAIFKSPVTYTLVDIGIIVIFWLYTLQRWIRVARGQPLRRDIGIRSGDWANQSAKHQPSLDELISGDLIVAAALTFMLALIFRAQVITSISDVLRTGVGINTCYLSWPVGNCNYGGLSSEPPTLSYIDLVISIGQVVVGLAIFALGMLFSGLARSGYGLLYDYDDPDIQMPVAVLRIATGRLTQVLERLRDCFWGAVRLALVVLSVFALAAASRETQDYFHLISLEHTCNLSGYLTCDYVSHTLITGGQPYTSLLYAIAFGVTGLVAMIVAIGLGLRRMRVISNTLRAVWHFGGIVAPRYWLFALLLSGINGLLWLLNNSVRVPFAQPEVLTVASALLFVVGGILHMLQGRRSSAV